MNAKSPFNETVIANALVAIFERLDSLEKATNILAGHHLAKVQGPAVSHQPITEQAVLLEKLERLTLKRHAVLTATLGGQSYQQIAKAMKCDVTTVKLHLRATLSALDIRSRSVLLVSSPHLLEFITDAEYEHRYGVSKSWWLTENSKLMAVLRATKPANNQHTPKP